MSVKQYVLLEGYIHTIMDGDYVRIIASACLCLSSRRSRIDTMVSYRIPAQTSKRNIKKNISFAKTKSKKNISLAISSQKISKNK